MKRTMLAAILLLAVTLPAVSHAGFVIKVPLAPGATTASTTSPTSPSVNTACDLALYNHFTSPWSSPYQGDTPDPAYASPWVIHTYNEGMYAEFVNGGTTVSYNADSAGQSISGSAYRLATGAGPVIYSFGFYDLNDNGAPYYAGIKQDGTLAYAVRADTGNAPFAVLGESTGTTVLGYNDSTQDVYVMSVSGSSLSLTGTYNIALTPAQQAAIEAAYDVGDSTTAESIQAQAVAGIPASVKAKFCP